jgi:excisionase family DNA binding protein
VSRATEAPPLSAEEFAQLGAVATVAETARFMRSSEDVVRDAIAAGSIHHVKLGRKILVPTQALITKLSGGE